MEIKTIQKTVLFVAAAAILFSLFSCSSGTAGEGRTGTIRFTVRNLKSTKGTVHVKLVDKALWRNSEIFRKATADNAMFGGVLARHISRQDFELLLSSRMVVPDDETREYFVGLYEIDAAGEFYDLKDGLGEDDIAEIKRIQEKSYEIYKGKYEVTFEGFSGSEIQGEIAHVPHGNYAVEVWQDENGNGQLDEILGLPLEGWGVTKYTYPDWLQSFYYYSIPLASKLQNVEIQVNHFYDGDPDFTGNVKLSGSRGFPDDIYRTDMHLKEVYFKGKAVNDDFKLDISWLGKPSDHKNCPVVYITDSYYRRPQYKYIHYLSSIGEIPPVLVVGIGYKEGKAYDDLRNRELTNYPDSFLDLIENEILPLAEKGFSVDTQKRILFGHSNGGRFSLYTMFKQAESGTRIFSDFIAGSTATYGWDFTKLAPKAGSVLPYILYMSVGTYENLMFFGGNKELYELLSNNDYKDFTYYYNLYPHRTHYQSSIPALVDGVCLILGGSNGAIPVLEDLDKTHTRYDFSYPVQSYDWYFSEHYKNSAGRSLTPSPDPKHLNGGISCMKLICEFTSECVKVPVSTGLEASDIPEIDLSVDIYAPADLAELEYEVELFIVSSERWLMETSDKQILKQGWNSYSFKWTDETSKGDLSNVGGIGLWIGKPEKAKNWSGDIYIDNFNW